MGIIYCAATVSPAPGTTVDVLVDDDLAALGFTPPLFIGPATNRAPLAASFEENSTGERFTVAVNHLKSKDRGRARRAGVARDRPDRERR